MTSSPAPFFFRSLYVEAGRLTYRQSIERVTRFFLLFDVSPQFLTSWTLFVFGTLTFLVVILGILFLFWLILLFF